MCTNWRQTYGFLSCVCKGIWVGVDNLALDLVGPASIVSQATSNHRNINLCHSDGLAVVERLDGSQEVGILLNQIGELNQQLATVLWGLLSPCALECLAGSSYRNVDIFLCGLVDRADNLFGGRVDGLEGLAVNTLDPLVVDEPRRQNC
jgi:hypothetical protein